MQQITALIDGNNFYAACEQSLNPALAGRPLVVLSNNDGCIIARSSEARSLGITMGEPYFKVRKKLLELNVAVCSSNYTLYGDMSQRFMRLLQKHCEAMEVYSIDEAFILLKHPQHYELYSWGQELRADIYQSLGLPISIGIGHNKCQSKIANHIAKERPEYGGIFDLTTVSDPGVWLETIAIENVWGVGRKIARWCRLRGISTARQLRDMSSNELRAKYGVTGLRIQHELRGEICMPLNTSSPNKKETCVSRSFSRPITRKEELREAIATYVVRGSEKLRRQKQRAGVLTIFTRTSTFSSDFYNGVAKAELDLPSNDTFTLLAATLPLVEQIFQPYRELMKAGVIMQHLQETKYLQQHFMSTCSPNKQQSRDHLMYIIDKINHRYGYGTVSWAACGLGKGWRMCQNKLSKASTTQLKEIPIAYA